MIDPEEQLRRLAEWRSEAVGAYSPPEPVAADVVPIDRRRWPAVAAAAAAVVVAVGGVVVLSSRGDDPPSEIVTPVPEAPPSPSSSSTSTTTTLGDLVVPSVVGDDPDAAVRDLEEQGFEVHEEVFLTTPDDPRLGEIQGQDLVPGQEVPPGTEMVIRIALLPEQWANGRDRCARSPYLRGDLDGDGRVDGLYPRGADELVTEIEVCAADGTVATGAGLALARVEAVADLDLDGLSEIIAPEDGEGRRTRLLSLLDGEVVAAAAALSFGEELADGATTWWGCRSFEGSPAERLAVGSWSVTAAGSVEWTATETWVQDGQFVAGRTEAGGYDQEYVSAATGPITPPGRDRCAPPPPSGSPCIVDGALVGDLNGDGLLDAVDVRGGLVCLNGGLTADVGEITAGATTWWLGDVEGDGRLEVFLGTTTAFSTTVQPYAVTDEAGLEAIGAGPLEQWVPAWAVLPDVEPRWFSCLAPTADGPGRIVTGSFWVDADAGTVRWTVEPEPSEASEDSEDEGDGDRRDRDAEPIVYEATFDDPTATDAWVPGNGCQRATWAGERVEFADDGEAAVESIVAINAWLGPNDPEGVRRFLVAREALGIAGSIAESSGPYGEDAAAGVIEVHGLHDDSVGALRWEITLSEDRAELLAITRTWQCARGEDTVSWTTERCP